MTIIDDYFNTIPDYYNSMYMDGFKPEQIIYAIRRGMIDSNSANEEDFDISKIKIVSEVKIR